MKTKVKKLRMVAQMTQQQLIRHFAVGITLCAVLIVSFISMLGANIYYKNHS